MKCIALLSLMLLAGTVGYGAVVKPKRGVAMEVWENIKGGHVASMEEAVRTHRPNAVYIVGNIDETAYGLDNFAARFTALLTAPETGEYTFYIAADDSAEMLLSTDATADNLQKICEAPSYMPRHHFVQGRSSGKVSLRKGQKYYLVVNFKEAVHGEHVALAWEGPGIKKKIIGRKYLSPVLKPELEQLWQQTEEREKRGRELEKAMLSQETASLSDWLDKLTHEENHLLAARMHEVHSGMECLTPEQRLKRLHKYVKAAEGLEATPETPVSNPVGKRLLQLEDEWLGLLSDKQLIKRGAHRLAASLGKIPADAKAVTSTQKLNSAADKWREEFVSTGLYALPGKRVKVTIPSGYLDKKLEMRVGHHLPEKNNPLVSMPNTTRWYKLDKETTSFVTPHGGLLLLKVPREVGLDNMPITIDGAIEAPRFILGKNTDEDWATLKKAPAPWGELVSEHVVLVAPRDVLQKLTNPTELMTWWNVNTRDLEDFYSYYPKVPFRMHSGHYAEEGISWWPLQWAPANMAYLLNLGAMKENNSALFLHEHGHHCDFWEMELSFWAESTPNWGGYYMKDRKGKSFNWKDSHDTHLRNLFNPDNEAMKEIMQDKWYKIASKGTHHWSYPITTMMIGYAETFGWEGVKETIRRIRDRGDEMYQWDFVQGADDDQAKIDRYLIGLSEAARRDVRPYFAHFKMFPSAGADQYLDDLKLSKWDLTYLVQPESATTLVNTPLAIPCGKEQLLSFARDSRVKWKAASAKGGTVVFKGGVATYTPKAGFKGVDTLTYELSNQYGKPVVKTMEITVQ